MVYVYAADITGLPDPLERPQLMEGLSQARKQKIVHYKQADSRKQSLAAGLLLKQVLAHHGAGEEEVYVGGNGKPEVKEVYFNLSHSHHIVVCVVGEKPVGVDVEKIGDPTREKIAERYFCESEVSYLESHTDEFFRLWTLKESYVKMTGEGLRLPLNRYEVQLEDQVKIYRDGELCHCFVKEYDIPGYCLSVCAEEADFRPQIELVLLAKNGGC